MRKSTLIVACIQLLMVIMTVESLPISRSDIGKIELTNKAVDAIKNDADVQEQFCHANDITQDKSVAVKITYPVDEEDPSSNYLVELGIIVRGLLGCDESEEDEAQVDCEVAIGNDEANSIVSVSCDSFRRNHAQESGGNSGSNTGSGSSTGAGTDGGSNGDDHHDQDGNLNEGQEGGDNTDSGSSTGAGTDGGSNGDDHHDQDGNLNEGQEDGDNTDSGSSTGAAADGDQMVGGFTGDVDPNSEDGQALVAMAFSAIRSDELVKQKFCKAARINFLNTVSITSQVVQGVNYKVTLDVSFNGPRIRSCANDQSQARCEVIIYQDLGQNSSVESVNCN